MLASVVLDLLALSLDDEFSIHSERSVLLSHLSRAQQWVALRYRVIRHTVTIPLVPTAPFVDLLALVPRFFGVTHVALGGIPLAWAPYQSLRIRDPLWLQTPGTPTLYYRVGLRWLGLVPVPTVAGNLRVTGIVAPLPLLREDQQLEVPDAYTNRLIAVSTGLLLVTREHLVEEGLRRVAAGLGMAARQPEAVTA